MSENTLNAALRRLGYDKETMTAHGFRSRRRRNLDGRWLPVVRIEIRRESGEAADIDEVGEIWAKGPNVMLGYWRNDVATTEVKRDGWLKVSDMGRLDADGFLYIVGRRSDMIKAGSHRIHPQDIEEGIAELPGVQEAAVVGIADELVPSPKATLTPMQVQVHCRARLASHKVPKSVEMVTSLPRTASGKIRRIELILKIDLEAEANRIAERLREITSQTLRRRGMVNEIEL